MFLSSYRTTSRALLLLVAMFLYDLSTITVDAYVIISSDTCLHPLPEGTVSEPDSSNFKLIAFNVLTVLTDKCTLRSLCCAINLQRAVDGLHWLQ